MARGRPSTHGVKRQGDDGYEDTPFLYDASFVLYDTTS